MSSDADLPEFDITRLSIAGTIPLSAPSCAPRHQRGEPFLRGPVPLAWLGQAAQLPGKALFVGVLLWHLAGMKNRRVVKWQPQRAKQFGISRHVVYRSLASLESANLIVVDRKSGRAPLVTIMNCSPMPGTSRTKSRFDDGEQHSS